VVTRYTGDVDSLPSLETAVYGLAVTQPSNVHYDDAKFGRRNWTLGFSRFVPQSGSRNRAGSPQHRLLPNRCVLCARSTQIGVLGENQARLFNFHAASIGEGFCGPGDGEAAFFEHADGAEIVVGSAGVERAFLELWVAQELLKRRGGDALAPVLPVDPVGDMAFMRLRSPWRKIARYRADDLITDHDRFIDIGRIGEVFPPSCHTRIAIGRVLRRERSHAVGDGVELVLEEGLEVGFARGAQSDLREQLCTLGF
jgi:hypothetical protein